MAARRAIPPSIAARSTASRCCRRSQIEVVVADNVVEEVIQTIIAAARTGEIGDGRVFVLPVEHGYNIRTGERDMT